MTPAFPHFRWSLAHNTTLAFVLWTGMAAAGTPAPENTGIDWKPWSVETFQRAQKENRPVLLFLSNFWSHWCRLMEGSTFQSPEVRKELAKSWVAIQVDGELRPDLFRRYEQGAWPSVAFLTPTGAIISGGKFLTSQQLLTELQRVRSFYKEREESIREELDRPTEAPQQIPTPGPEEELSFTIVSDIFREVQTHFDSQNGGFGSSPKFHAPGVISFALSQGIEGGLEPGKQMALQSLLKISESPIHDIVDGGFFRFSVSENWGTPQYEKLLRDNVELLLNLLEAFQVTGEAQWKDLALSQWSYLAGTLKDPEGGYYGSQAADSLDRTIADAGGSGARYYKLPAQERRKLQPPPVEKVFYSGLNGEAIPILLKGSAALGEPAWKEAAVTCYRRLWGLWNEDKGLPHAMAPGSQPAYGFLADNTALLSAALALHQYTGDETYLVQALKLAEWLRKHFKSPSGGYWDCLPNEPSLQPVFSKEVLLNTNAAHAAALYRLGMITGQEPLMAEARHVLLLFRKGYAEHSYLAAPYGQTVALVANQPIECFLVAAKDDPKRQAFREALTPLFAPGKILVFLDPKADAKRLAALELDPASAPYVLIRWRKHKSAPVIDPAYVKVNLEKIVANMAEAGKK